jgi:YD repeat-containing protein
VTAITDPNGVTTRFDYDNYSRLTGSYYLDENARKVMLQKYVYHFGK